MKINHEAPIAPGVVLVGLMPGVTVNGKLQKTQVSDSALEAAFTNLGVREIEPLFPGAAGLSHATTTKGVVDLHNIYRLHLGSGGDVWSAVEALNANPAVLYAEPDYIAHVITTPNDTLYAEQWGLNRINASTAWDVITGTASVAIAVLDSGIDTTHPDLTGQLWVNPGEIPGNGIDDDNDGYIDDIHGVNIYANNTDLTDSSGHGTQVAGIIAAATNNHTGIAGLCWSCKLMIVKVTQPGGISNYSDIAAGVLYAAQKGAKVINLSLGGYTNSTTLSSAIQVATQTAVVVGGAGNDDSSQLFYPASYDQVLAVAGSTITDTKVSTSNFGSWVDVSAPGEVITTTFSGGGYGAASGTSMAAPFAAGLAGLLWSQHPGWSPSLVRAQIIHTTDNIDSQNQSYAGELGSGRINAEGAVTITPSPLIKFVNLAADGQVDGRLKTGKTVSLTVTLGNDWLDAASVMATLSTSSSDVTVTKATADWGAIASGQSATNNADPFQVAVKAGAYGSNIPFTLQVAADGISSSVPFTATTESIVQSVGGMLNTDTLWTNDRVYRATGNVIVGTGVTLTIQAGTTVEFDSGKVLLVNGTLLADGTSSAPIRFTSSAAKPAPGDWGASVGCMSGGIIFSSSSQPAQFDPNGSYQSGSIIRNSIIEYSQGISIQSASPFIDQNLIWKNGGFAAVSYTNCPNGSDPVISHNRIISNTGHAVASGTSGQPIIRQNQISHNSQGLSISGEGAVISNTVMMNGGTFLCNAMVDGTVCLPLAGVQPLFTANNIFANAPAYDLIVGGGAGQTFTATGNYWGTTDPSVIQSHMYDSNQDLNLGTIGFSPFLLQPEPSAPAFLSHASLNPTSPVGIQSVSFTLTFNKPMDQSLDPMVTFGATEPYTSYAVVDNAQWITSTVWRASYDFTSLIPRGTYTLSVSGAKGLDGMEIPVDTRFGFSVDYAGQITDQTPPNTPSVLSSGKLGDPSYVEAIWSANDPDSSITGYRYAIGSAAGASDIVNWTTTTDSNVSRSGLGLVNGRQYWFAVEAQNVGGLWSNPGYSAFTAGQGLHKVYLSFMQK